MEEGLCGKVGAKCGRWNPTTEQMKVLTELFSAGLRTPTTEQIQMIASRLSSLGKIESKNVFYWFQNHKARERHHHDHHSKRRRQTSPPPLPLHHSDHSFSDISHHSNGSFASTTRSAVFIEEEMNEPAEESHREMKTLELFPISSSGYHFGADQYKTRSNRSVGNDDAVGDLCFLQHAVDEHPLNLTLGFF